MGRFEKNPSDHPMVHPFNDPWVGGARADHERERVRCGQIPYRPIPRSLYPERHLRRLFTVAIRSPLVGCGLEAA